MGGKAGTGRRLWLSRDEDGKMDLWGAEPRRHLDAWYPVRARDLLNRDGIDLDELASPPLKPGECIELREVRRTKGGE